MKKVILIGLLFVISANMSLFAQSKKGVISGTIQNSKHELLSGISVQIQGTKSGAITNDDGFYEIKNIEQGNYTMLISAVGYKISKENITIKPGEVTNLDLQLNEATWQLEPVTVKGTRKNKYVAKTSSSGLRMPLDLVETPQSIQVIPQQVILDEQAQNLNDLTKNMVGVINNNNYSSFTMRGFSSLAATSTNNFITTDGFLGNMYYWQQSPFLYNIDRVENIGGPDAALYSVGTPGGIINMVTKKPLDHPYYSFNITTGSWGLIDASVDLAGPLTKNKKLQYRLNIGFNNQNSVAAYQYSNNIVIAPSIAYQFSDKTSISLDYVRNDYNTREFEYWGGALLMKPDSTYDWKNIKRTSAFYSTSDYAVTHNNSLSMTFNHEFSKTFKLTLQSRYTHSSLNSAGFSGTFYAGENYFTSYPDSVPFQYVQYFDKSYNFITSLFTTETFGNDKFKQTFVTGIDFQDYGGKDYYGIWETPDSGSFFNPGSNHFYYSPLVYPDSNAEYLQNNKNHTIQFGPYAQDLISIGKHIKMLAALRYETYSWKISPLGMQIYATNYDTSTAHVFIARGGFVYSFNKNQTAYASFNESYQPQYNNARGYGGPFKPTIAQQEEIGFKQIFFNGKMMATVAAYNIYYKNILEPSATNPNLLVLVPGLFSRGAELTVQGNLNQWSVFGSYAYNHITFAANSPLGTKGQRYDNSPTSIANFHVKYRFENSSPIKGLSIMSGGQFVGKLLGSAQDAPKFLQPGYFLLDAGINYQIKRFDFSLNGYNITNKVYVPGYYASDFMVMPGNPFNWKFSIRYTIK
ncbi:MAG TPA: TonB-dependent receptor [Puia sp.]|nr:TonB-dependent receptor [Puia sp.]